MNLRGHRVFRIYFNYLFLFSLGGVPINAQVNLFGYGEFEYDGIQVKESDYSFGYGKIRLEGEWRPIDIVLIAGNVNGQKFFGKTKWDFFDFIPFDTLWVEEEHMTSMPLTIFDTLFLDNFYARFNFSKLDLTLGRQPLSLGTGYAWNPLDIFNRKDLLDPTYEQPGVNAVRIEIPINDRSSMDIIIAENDSLKTGTKMVQMKTGIGSFDITMNIAQRHHLFPFWRLMNIMSTHTTSEFFGGSLVGQLGEFGFWGEAFLSMENTKSIGEYVIGTDHTFDNGVYVMAEYFHNSLGATKDELSIYHYVHAYGGESKSLTQNYGFALTRFSFNDFISGSLMTFGNLDDKSFSLAPQVEWSIFENVTASILFSQSFGKMDTEFGIQGKALRLRVRGYF